MERFLRPWLRFDGVDRWWCYCCLADPPPTKTQYLYLLSMKIKKGNKKQVMNFIQHHKRCGDVNYLSSKEE